MADLAAIVEILGHVFTQCDRDSNGAVNKSELIRACRSNPELAEFWGLPYQIWHEGNSWDPWEQAFQEIDGDADRLITWTEFLNYHLNQGVESAQPAKAILPPAVAASEHAKGLAKANPESFRYVGSGEALGRSDLLLGSMPHAPDTLRAISGTVLAAYVEQEPAAGSARIQFPDCMNPGSVCSERPIAGSAVLIGGSRMCSTSAAAQRTASPMSQRPGSTVLVGGSAQIPVTAAVQRAASPMRVAGSTPLPVAAQRSASPMSSRMAGETSLMGGPTVSGDALVAAQRFASPVRRVSMPATIAENVALEVHSAVLPQSMPGHVPASARMTSDPQQSSLQFPRQLTSYRGRLDSSASGLAHEVNAEVSSDDEQQERRRSNPWKKLARNLRGFVDDIKVFAEDVAEGWEELFAYEEDDDKHDDGRKGHDHAQRHRHHSSLPKQQRHSHLAQSMPPAMMTECRAMQGHGGPMPYDLQHYSYPPGFAVPAAPPSSVQLPGPEMASASGLRPQQWQASPSPMVGASPFALWSLSQLPPQQVPLGSTGPGAAGSYMLAPEAGPYQSLPPFSSELGMPVSQTGSMSPLGSPMMSHVSPSTGVPLGRTSSLPPGSMGSLPYPMAPQSRR